MLYTEVYRYRDILRITPSGENRCLYMLYTKPGNQHFLFVLCLKAYVQAKLKNRHLMRSPTPSSFGGHHSTTVTILGEKFKVKLHNYQLLSQLFFFAKTTPLPWPSQATLSHQLSCANDRLMLGFNGEKLLKLLYHIC